MEAKEDHSAVVLNLLNRAYEHESSTIGHGNSSIHLYLASLMGEEQFCASNFSKAERFFSQVLSSYRDVSFSREDNDR